MNFINPQQNLVGAVKQLQQMMQGKPVAELKPKVAIKKRKIEFPAGLDNPLFLIAWQEWVQFRIEAKKALTVSTTDKQLKKLSKYKLETAIAMIEQSIENGWMGLFDVNATAIRATPKPAINKDDNDILQWNKNRGWVEQSTLAQLKAHPTFMANMANDKFRLWAIGINPIVKEIVL